MVQVRSTILRVPRGAAGAISARGWDSNQVKNASSKAARFGRIMGYTGVALAALSMTTSSIAQTVGDDSTPQTSLNIPSNLQIFGKVDPNIRKATAIVNDSVITGTDVDQRVALIMAANQLKLSDEDKERL
jgi:peptidyl-prolyl cis-trans isomerase SurA